jgi:hypothetical protein
LSTNKVGGISDELFTEEGGGIGLQRFVKILNIFQSKTIFESQNYHGEAYQIILNISNQ